jgi:DNA invertase Pin-like site-specific DNA recombinase
VRFPLGIFTLRKAGFRYIGDVQTAYAYIRFSHEDQLLGDSERRQSESAEAYAREHGMSIDYSLKPDRAISAFRGKHRKKGNLAAFVKKIQSGEVKPGSALIVESLDRLSREEPEEALFFLLELVRAGIEIHATLDRSVYRRGEMDEMRLFNAILIHSRSSQESKRKSERLSQIAAQNREKARSGQCITTKAPGWLIAVKGGKIEPHPKHAKTVKCIFQLASEGIGCTRIVDILNKERVPAFNRTGRWYDMYISEIIRSRAVLGEFQPGTHPRGGKWAPAGEPIKDYYPRIIDDELWYRVQEIRAGNWAKGKVKVGKYHGSGKASWRNLFTGLVVDQDGDSVIYKRVAHRAYFISSNRTKFKTHKMRYELFEAVMLKLLRDDIDYKSLAKQATPIKEEVKLQLNDTLAEIAQKERLRTRYLRVIEGEAEPDEEIIAKFRATGIELKKLKDKKESLQLSIKRTVRPKLTKIPVIEINETREESNLQLKDEIRKRVAQIQITFGLNIITAPDPDRKIMGVRPGKGQIGIRVTFVNGAVKMAIIDGPKATLLS